jgi:hypothetical protein
MYSGGRWLLATNPETNKSAPKSDAPPTDNAAGPGGPTRCKNTGFVPAYVGGARMPKHPAPNVQRQVPRTSSNRTIPCKADPQNPPTRLSKNKSPPQRKSPSRGEARCAGVILASRNSTSIVRHEKNNFVLKFCSSGNIPPGAESVQMPVCLCEQLPAVSSERNVDSMKRMCALALLAVAGPGCGEPTKPAAPPVTTPQPSMTTPVEPSTTTPAPAEGTPAEATTPAEKPADDPAKSTNTPAPAGETQP